jgi:uncharacterized membrane protein YjjP (DUF1212 family)
MSKVKSYFEDQNELNRQSEEDREAYELHVWSSVNVVVRAIQDNQIDPEDVMRVLSAIEQRSLKKEVANTETCGEIDSLPF